VAADLVDEPGRREIGLADALSIDWRAEGPERVKDAGRVLDGRPDQDVQIAGCPRNSIHHHGMRTNDDELRTAPCKGPEDVGEVLISRRCTAVATWLRPSLSSSPSLYLKIDQSRRSTLQV
jgi:hypothetical protein